MGGGVLIQEGGFGRWDFKCPSAHTQKKKLRRWQNTKNSKSKTGWAGGHRARAHGPLGPLGPHGPHWPHGAPWAPWGPSGPGRCAAGCAKRAVAPTPTPLVSTHAHTKSLSRAAGENDQNTIYSEAVYWPWWCPGLGGLVPRHSTLGPVPYWAQCLPTGPSASLLGPVPRPSTV